MFSDNDISKSRSKIEKLIILPYLNSSYSHLLDASYL